MSRGCVGYEVVCSVFFFNDTATTEIYTLSLHDALPIWIGAGILCGAVNGFFVAYVGMPSFVVTLGMLAIARSRSEEHTSELQSHSDLVCRLLLEKKKARYIT